MNLWRLALGALLIVVAISLGALLSRALVVPTGAHRATGLMRPQLVPVNDLAWCPAEERETLHAFHEDGRQCWTCRTFTPEVDRG